MKSVCVVIFADCSVLHIRSVTYLSFGLGPQLALLIFPDFFFFQDFSILCRSCIFLDYVLWFFIMKYVRLYEVE